jgi:tetratricopeptide (TPR) repeat protein
MRARRLLILSLLLATCLIDGRTSARAVNVVELLDRYTAGQFDAVVQILTAQTEFDPILTQLERDAPAWIAAASPYERDRRELAAATFALEAARAGQWREWKLIQKQEAFFGTGGGGPLEVLNVLYWKAPPLLIEWGCKLLRKEATPRPIERWWQLAALAVAQRSEDTQFLVGDPNIGKGVAAGEIGNLDDEIKHLDHVRKRFPKEMRFVLAEGIARDRVWTDDATTAYMAIENDPDVGGEAMMRFGAMQLRLRQVDQALRNLQRADGLTRDPYVVYLARYFTGVAFEQQNELEDAEDAYRGAAATIPHAQSATLALAALAFKDGRHSEAHRLARGMLEANPAPIDPWPTYVHADDRFWPQLVGRLRAGILK